MIVDDDDRVTVDRSGSNIPEKYRPLLDAFGVLYVADHATCTVTHIGKGIIVTAGHCIDAPNDEIEGPPAERLAVRWGVRGKSSMLLRLESRVLNVLAARRSRPGPDYAFMKVDPAPPAFVNVDLTHRAQTGTKITLFGHPSGNPLVWSRECEVLAPSATGGPERFEHRCDTEGGTSGSVILDVQTLAVVGIHNSHNGTDNQPATMNQATHVLDTPLTRILERQ